VNNRCSSYKLRTTDEEKEPILKNSESKGKQSKDREEMVVW